MALCVEEANGFEVAQSILGLLLEGGLLLSSGFDFARSPDVEETGADEVNEHCDHQSESEVPRQHDDEYDQN